MKPLTRDAKALSKLLGDDHDLALLAAKLPADDPLQPLIGDRRAELQDAAHALGARIYAGKPTAFRKHVRRKVRAVA